MNLFIEAGAGTGKTTRLIEYILDDIEHGNDVKELVCITFTNKAANELRSRLQDKLRYILKTKQRVYIINEKITKNLDEETLKLYKNAYNNITLMNISTIHSFCSNLLIERAIDGEYGFDVDFDLEGDGEKKRLYLSSLFNQFIKDNYKDINYSLIFKYFSLTMPKILKYYDFEIGNNQKIKNIVLKDKFNYEKSLKTYKDLSLNKYKDNLKRIYTETLNNIDNFVRMTLSNNDPYSSSNIDVFLNIYMEYVQEKIIKYPDLDSLEDIENKKIFNTLGKNISDKCSSSKHLFDTYQDYLLINGNKASKKSQLNDFNQEIASYFSPKSTQDNPSLRDMNEEEIKNYRNSLDIKYFDYYYCINLFIQFREYLISNNINLSIFDNDDLIVKSRDLVKHNKVAREYFKDKYKKYYIDEFQDTDIIQLELFFILNSKNNVEENKIIDPLIKLDYEIRDDSLVFVGDPKQSIYAFRDADIDMYLKARSYFEEHDNTQVISLDKTYRYRDDIKTAVDHIFGNEDNPYKIDLGVTYDKVKSKDNLKSKDVLSGFYQVIPDNNHKDSYQVLKFKDNYISSDELMKDIDVPDDSIDNKDNNSIESCGIESLPGLIEYLRLHKIYDNNSLRNIDYKDIMILTDKKRSSALIGEVLTKHNIPVNNTGVDDDINEFDDQENRALISDFKVLTEIKSILTLLINPFDIYSFYTLMMFVYGYDLDRLIDLKNDQNIISDYHLIVFDKENKELNEQKDKYKDVLDLKRYIVHLYSYENMISVLEDILNNDKILNSKYVRIRDVEYTLLYKALENMRSEDIRSYKELLNSFIKNTETISEKNLILNSSRNEVRVMNLHKAKGLESEIVIYFNDKIFKEEESNYVYLPKSTEHLKTYFPLLDQDNRYIRFTHSLSYENEGIRDITKQESKEEHGRKIFVGLTRAKSAIFVLNEQKNQEIYKALMNKCPKVDEFRKESVSISEKDNFSEITNVLSLKDELKSKRVDKTYFITPSKTKTNHSKIYKDLNGDIIIQPINYELLFKDDVKKDIDRKNKSPLYGSEYGTIMHKVFELIVIDYSNNKISLDLRDEDFKRYLESSIKDYLNQSPIYAFIRDILSYKREYMNNEDDIKEIFYNHQSKCLKEMLDVFVNDFGAVSIISSTYESRLKDILLTGETFYPELEFDIVVKKESIDLETLRDILGEKELDLIETSNTYRIGGIMDLLVKTKEGKYIIYDYKTNKKDDNNLDRSEFENLLKTITYKNQLKCYTLVVHFITREAEENIQTSIISVGLW